MTTHELAQLLLAEPDVPLHVEGWTSDDIEIVRPEWSLIDEVDVKMLANAEYKVVPHICSPPDTTTLLPLRGDSNRIHHQPET